jgi:hypothetical protein
VSNKYEISSGRFGELDVKERNKKEVRRRRRCEQKEKEKQQRKKNVNIYKNKDTNQRKKKPIQRNGVKLVRLDTYSMYRTGIGENELERMDWRE